MYDDSPSARVGIYYYENGAYPRKPKVIYDRANSSFYSLKIDEIPEKHILRPGVSIPVVSPWPIESKGAGDHD